MWLLQHVAFIMFLPHGWAMLLKYTVANAFQVPVCRGQCFQYAFGRQPHLGRGRPEAAPIMCSASIESIGLRIFEKHWTPVILKALAIHIL